MSHIAPFIVSRVFDAPRKLVYQVHVEPRHLSRWTLPPKARELGSVLDFRVGGTHHYGYTGPDGAELWGLRVFREIAPNERVVHVQSFSNRAGALSRHPLALTWPLKMLATTTFEDAGEGKTKVTVFWLPFEADESEMATFDAARAQMEQGFNGMFDGLSAYLAATDKEIQISRWLKSPRALVWRMLTEPVHVNAWWGPNGFKNVDVVQHLRVGGEWKFRMLGPDGAVYPNLCTYLEITKPARLVFDHGDGEQVLFRQTVLLDEEGEGTRITLLLSCKSRKFRDSAVEFAIEGGEQTLAKLETYLRGQRGSNAEVALAGCVGG